MLHYSGKLKLVSFHTEWTDSLFPPTPNSHRTIYESMWIHESIYESMNPQWRKRITYRWEKLDTSRNKFKKVLTACSMGHNRIIWWEGHTQGRKPDFHKGLYSCQYLALSA